MDLVDRKYRPRIIDKAIDEALQNYGAVSIEGPRWCGKTWTMLSHANSATMLADENERALAEMNPASALVGDTPHAIDEWQAAPHVWDAVRSAVDKDPSRGRFILTGSVTPPRTSVFHSGIGRITRIRMRTMSLFESGASQGKVSLSELLDGKKVQATKGGLPVFSLIENACIGGWPVNLSAPVKNPYVIPSDYLDSIMANDLPGYNVRVRNEPKFRYLLASLARNNATIVKNATLHNDVQTAADEFSGKTLASYLQLLRDLFILEEIPGWNPRIRSKARILSSPKRLFTDPSLAVAALGATPNMLWNELAVFGGVFEGLCLRDLLIYAEAGGDRVFHYRDDSGLEVDAIVEKRDGSWSAFEIKLGGRPIDSAAASLIRLSDKIVGYGGKPPVCLAVITGTEFAIQRDDGVSVVPISLLRE
jgi:predicted AAA+ superfamily ATPase